MNLDELRSAQAKERRKDSLQHLRDSFYDDVGAYVADLRAARDRRAEQVENPFADDDVRRLSDEVETAEEVAEALYERRVGKVVKLASFAAADMSVDEEGMTTEERRLFDDLVERITANKSTVLDVLAGDSPVASGSAADDSPGAESPAAADPAESVDSVPGDRRSDDSAAEVAESSAEASSTDPSSRRADADENAADALTGAMGGNGGEAPLGASSEPTEDDAAPDVPEQNGDAATDGDDEPTPVPPEPAPPGAVGVEDDSDDAVDGTPAGDAVDNAPASDAPDGAPASDADEGPSAEATTDGGAVSGGAAGGDPDADPGPDGETERATVRITRDVGAIFGVDEREYELASEDVVSLPVENADPLVQRDAAERID
ncbi:DNA replication complex GINS family protein [Halorubrum sp. GN11_10-6_MGM]|uniref:DNA replication complex subunit Gins51 n=1 Tax=Halorubrum sp. GN11_10-6_MGM TaxID=2518112 RepID=UPI0010F5D059|nr:hypothetical protein [Halorubrum sp. GN11_10-6_MGM]TKX75746.1 DNA replication complex GINS family protein [Halorubrum sp. GN11_10-6_MGM]